MSAREPGQPSDEHASDPAAGPPQSSEGSDESTMLDLDPADDPDRPRAVGNGHGYGITRAALVLVALALGLGLLVGRVSVNTDPAAVAQPSASSTATQRVIPLGPTSLQETGSLCSLQRGKDLVLGVEVRNLATVPAQLRRLQVTLPAKGLRLVATGVGACGEIDVPRLSEFGLPTQGTVWLSATVRVQVACPAKLPVSMTIYAADLTGKVQAIKVPGFTNLKAATWSGCATSTKASSTTSSRTSAGKSTSNSSPKQSTASSSRKKKSRSTR